VPRRQPADDAQLGLEAEDQTDPGQTEQDHHPERRHQIVGKEPERPPAEQEPHREKAHTFDAGRTDPTPGQDRAELGAGDSTGHEDQERQGAAKHALSLL